jgi:peptide/nickel transport system substrate-binding protein
VYLTCAVDTTRVIASPVIAGAFRVRPDLSYQPVLVDRVKVDTSPFTLTYHLKQQAVWSDGVPITANDLLFTYKTLLNPANNVLSRAGYDRVTQATAVDAKTARFVFDHPYPAWKSLFPQVLPKHALDGEDFNAVWTAWIGNPKAQEPIGSGPYLLTEYLQGTQITLTRNPEWWGARPQLDGVTFRFIASIDAQVQALLAGELDAIHPPASASLAGAQGAPGIAFETGSDRLAEHLDFNTVSSTMPLLRQSWFREAVAYALDRDSSIDSAWGPLNVDVDPLDSLVYLSQQQEYKAVFDRFAYDPDRVARIMRRHGCAKGADGIWSCNGTRASIRFATTSGNARRDHVQQQLMQQARVAGIELVPDNAPSGVLFGTKLPSGDFDLTMFAWFRDVDPMGLGGLYGCDGSQNYMRYCSPQVTRLLDSADSEVSHQAALLHKADGALADDAPTLPFYQHPLFLARRTELVGPVLNAGPQGLTWNVADWRLG